MFSQLWALGNKVRDRVFRDYVWKTMYAYLRFVAASVVQGVYGSTDAGSELRKYVVYFFVNNSGLRCEMGDLRSEGCRWFKDDVLRKLLRGNDEFFEPQA
jgi:hypothetical protein